MRTTYFHLYKLSVEPKEDSEYTTFEEMLDNLPDEPITMAKSGKPFQLEGNIRKIGTLHYGTFCLIQKDDLPTKAKFGEEPGDLLGDGDEDAGLGHYTSFLYDGTNDVIAIQSNRNGVTANGVAAYFRRNFRVKEISLEIIINPDKLEELQRMTTISSFVISIAKPESGIPFATANQQKAFTEMTKIADDSNANTMTLHLGVGYEQNATLRKAGILPLIRSLFAKSQQHEVRKVEIKGREGDDAYLETLDLVNNKVIIPVSYKEVRTITPRFLRDIVKRAADEYSGIKKKIDTAYKVKRKQD